MSIPWSSSPFAPQAATPSGRLAIGPEVIRDALAQMVPPRPAADRNFADFVSQLLARARNGEFENVRESVAETVHREL